MTIRTKTQSLRPKKFPDHQVYITTVPAETLSDPSSYTQAVKHQHWRSTMASELDVLTKNITWDLIQPPPDANVISAKWLFKTKFRPDGQIERYKTRLVAKRFTQQEGIDYFEIFSPVVKPTTIRIMLNIALSCNWPLYQLDVNNTFLHGDLEEIIYIEQLPEFFDPLYPNHVCQLRKALYGLKQAPRAWFSKFKCFLVHHQFKYSQSDNSLFTLQSKVATIFMLVYVDHIIIIGTNSDTIKTLIQEINNFP
jgi:Reverse transcriptase (RNA-dependent DNA polymerase)